jgi:type II secretory pathway component PulF
MKEIKSNIIERIKLKLLFSTGVRLSLYDKISSFLKEGIPLNDILESLKEQYEDKTPGDIKITVIKIWMSRLAVGMTFSEAIKDMVPPGESVLIKAGEKSGDITTAFENAIMTTKASQKMVGTLKSGLAYPFVLILMLAGLIYMFSTTAVPELASVLEPSKWPDASKLLYSMSMFVKDYWWTVILAAMVFFYVVISSLSVLTGESRKFLNKIPPWSLYKTFQGSVFLISVSSMMKSGISIYEAIAQVKSLSPKYVKKEIDVIMKKLDSGIPVGESLNSGFLDKEIGMDIEIYGKLSNMQKVMGAIGEQSVIQGIAQIEVATKLISNIVLMFLATYIGWVYYSFYVLTKAMGQMASM